jgi:hypothetical protein
MIEKYISQSPEVAFRIIEDEAVILTPEDGMLHNLNVLATRIFELSDGSQRVKDIIQIICDEFEVNETVARRDILDFIGALQKKNILLLLDKPLRLPKK